LLTCRRGSEGSRGRRACERGVQGWRQRDSAASCSGGLAAKRLLIVGLGKQAKVTVNSVRNAAGTAVRFTKPRGIRELVFALPEAEALEPGLCARAAVEGALVGDYDPDTYRSDRKDLSVQSFTLAAPGKSNKKTVEAAFAEGVIVGESQNFTRASGE
jgi:leucyl aminopeptidase